MSERMRVVSPCPECGADQLRLEREIWTQRQSATKLGDAYRVAEMWGDAAQHDAYLYGVLQGIAAHGDGLAVLACAVLNLAADRRERIALDVKAMRVAPPRPYAESIPSVAQAAQALLPYLRIWGDSGYLGLSERDRNDANNAKCDLMVALERMLR